jgi:hypothetical protein
MLAKGIKRMAYEITFLFAEVYILQVVNKTLSKYRKIKKARVYQGSTLIIEDA